MSTTYLGIDIGSTQICAIIAEKEENKNIKILGVGSSKSQGLKKGVITNIDLASNSIKIALDDAKRMAGKGYDKAIVSISGAYVKSVDSNGIVNIPHHDIGIKEINRAMHMADHNANIPNEYEKIHVLPFSFKVDDQEYIEDPLGMTGSRLEVLVHIITVQRSSLNNLKKAVKASGVEIDNIVLSGYASAIATLNEDEKELGVCLIDMGGATCNMVVHAGNSLRYNDFLGVGSANITNDLSMALHTPLPAAEELKIQHGTLEETSNELIKIPVLGDEAQTQEVTLEIVSNVLYARVEETLMILAKILENSGFKEQIGAGIVLTGGFTKLKGIRELATAIFDNLSIRLAKPKETDGLFEIFKDPSYATALGLVMHESGFYTPYEIDCNKVMRHKEEKKHKEVKHESLDNMEALKIQNDKATTKEKLAEIADISKKDEDQSAISKLWHRLSQIF